MPKQRTPGPLGARIRRLRQEQGLTLTRLAGDAMTEAYVSLIESGKRQPSDRALAHIASQLGVDPEELRTGRPPGLALHLELDIQTVRREIDKGATETATKLLVKIRQKSTANGLNRLTAKVEELRGLMAERLDGPSAALPHYEKAEELWRSEPVHLRFGTVIGMSRCTDQMGDPQMAIHMLESYRHELEASGKPDPLALMQIHTALIYPCYSAGLPQKAAEAARAALALEGRVDDPEEIACMHLSVARTLTNEGEYGDALASLRKAEQIYLAGGWRNQVAKAQIAEGIVLATKEDYESAREALEGALKLLDESPNRLDEALAFNELGYVARKLDDIHGALTFLERARPLLEDTDIVEKAFNERELGLCLGTDKAAENHLKKAIDLYRVSGNTTELASTFKALGELYRSQGKTDLAFEAMREGLATVEERST